MHPQNQLAHLNRLKEKFQFPNLWIRKSHDPRSDRVGYKGRRAVDWWLARVGGARHRGRCFPGRLLHRGSPVAHSVYDWDRGTLWIRRCARRFPNS